jgi:hypothetical protein
LKVPWSDRRFRCSRPALASPLESRPSALWIGGTRGASPFIMPEHASRNKSHASRICCDSTAGHRSHKLQGLYHLRDAQHSAHHIVCSCNTVFPHRLTSRIVRSGLSTPAVGAGRPARRVWQSIFASYSSWAHLKAGRYRFEARIPEPCRDRSKTWCGLLRSNHLLWTRRQAMSVLPTQDEEAKVLVPLGDFIATFLHAAEQGDLAAITLMTLTPGMPAIESSADKVAAYVNRGQRIHV